MVRINCDGGSRGNPGKAAIGFVIRDGDKILLEKEKYIGITTNNVAEYTSLIEALTAARKFSDKATIIMDSELVVKQVLGEYKVKAVHLRPLLEQVRKLQREFKELKFENVPRDDVHQSRADFLVNQALDRAH